MPDKNHGTPALLTLLVHTSGTSYLILAWRNVSWLRPTSRRMNRRAVPLIFLQQTGQTSSIALRRPIRSRLCPSLSSSPAQLPAPLTLSPRLRAHWLDCTAYNHSQSASVRSNSGHNWCWRCMAGLARPCLERCPTARPFSNNYDTPKKQVLDE